MHLYKQTHFREDKISSKSRPLDNEFAGESTCSLKILYLYLGLKVSIIRVCAEVKMKNLRSFQVFKDLIVICQGALSVICYKTYFKNFSDTLAVK